jgi:NAD(P)-dependent dehydrogenase (short-subunit alcohol dehydrogenase family)
MAAASLLQSSSVVLVSGGARGITAQCVIRLAERARCNFILLGRSALHGVTLAGASDCEDETALKQLILEDLKTKGVKPTLQKIQKTYRALVAQREIEETLEAVRTAGGTAEYVQADITNRVELAESLAEPIHRLGRVTGIIHGAGNLADKLIEKKSVQDYENVFSAKVNGLENMLTCVPVSQLDFLVLFSSIVGFYGNAGQSDYAMANEILNKTALSIKHKYPRCRVVSIGWGPWDSGMVTPELKKVFEDNNVAVISAETGANLLAEELMPRSGDDAAQVVVGNPMPRPIENYVPELRRYEIRRRLSLDANPFLYDHQIGENPVLPATCAATWVASACEQLYPGHTFSTLENYKVLKGIVFDENLAAEYTLDLKEISKTPEGEVKFDALIWSMNKNGRKLFNYSLQVTLVKELPMAPDLEAPDLSAIDVKDEIAGSELYKNGTLFHGPAFQGVQRVLHVSQGKLIMLCTLPKVDEKVQGQFPVQTGNPFIYDAIVQSLLIWAQHFYQAPCLPSSMERLEQYRAIPFDEPVYVSLEVDSQSDTFVVGNLTVQNMQGQTYVRIFGLQGTISQRLNKVIGSRSDPS